MKKLSTNLTLFWRFYGIAWISFFLVFGLYLIFSSLTATERDFEGGKSVLFILFGSISSIFVYLMVGTLKNVILDGNSILISNYLKQIRIPLSDISHVANPDWSSLRRIRIKFRTPSGFGKEIVFSPPLFKAKEIANLLKNKIQPD